MDTRKKNKSKAALLPAGKLKPILGWREWVALPHLHISKIKAKLDTGARTSSLHVASCEYFLKQGRKWVRFQVHAENPASKKAITAEAELYDERIVKSSSGQASLRPVIITEIQLLNQIWPIEVTLANRDLMGFKLLLGREAIRKKFLINAGRSFLASPKQRKKKTK